MINMDNLNEMIVSNVFDDYVSFSEEEKQEAVRVFNYLINDYNNTKTKNGSYEFYNYDFTSELFSISSYKEIKKIQIFLFESMDMEIELHNGRKYIISNSGDWYFKNGVTALN